MDKFSTVPVVDVDVDNLNAVWLPLVSAIHKATFIAIDTEMSGLGDRKKLMAQFIEDRYKYMAEVTRTRAVLTLGISCFKKQKSDIMDSYHAEGRLDPETNDSLPQDTCKNNKKQTVYYKAQTFNLSVLCSQEFVVEPGSLQFLIQHGFDFNKQYSKGMPYSRGNDKTCDDYSTPSVRNLFSQLVIADKPIVLHNGLFDLLYLYQNFYADLPEKLEIFLSDLHEMFTAGIIDTKYVSEFHIREPASYLGYIFRKCQRSSSSSRTSCKPYADVIPESDDALQDWVDELCSYANVRTHDKDGKSLEVCDLYAARGFCNKGLTCPFSHDLDLILDKDMHVSCKKNKRKRKRASSVAHSTDETSESSSDNVSRVLEEGNNSCISLQTRFNGNGSSGDTAASTTTRGNICGRSPSSGGHRAGIDAFMTGYCLATYLTEQDYDDIEHSGWANKISLSGKDVPLPIVKSHFSRTSAAHSHKLKLIKGIGYNEQ